MFKISSGPEPAARPGLHLQLEPLSRDTERRYPRPGISDHDLAAAAHLYSSVSKLNCHV